MLIKDIFISIFLIAIAIWGGGFIALVILGFLVMTFLNMLPLTFVISSKPIIVISGLIIMLYYVSTGTPIYPVEHIPIEETNKTVVGSNWTIPMPDITGHVK